MDYFLTEEQVMIRDLARQIAKEKIRPVAAKYDKEGIFPWDIVKVLAESDLCGIYIDEKYGGTGGGVMDLVIATEELSKACGGISLAVAATALGTFPIILFGTDEQKAKYLPDIASGKKLAAFGLTEAGAGSDAAAIQTTAEKKGDHYVLNGTKQYSFDSATGRQQETFSDPLELIQTRRVVAATRDRLQRALDGLSSFTTRLRR